MREELRNEKKGCAMSEVARFETMILAIADGLRWPESQRVIRLNSSRNPKPSREIIDGAGREPFYVPGEVDKGGPDREMVAFLYTKADYDVAVKVVAKIQSDAVRKAAEQLVYPAPGIGPGWLRFDDLMRFSQGILLGKVRL